jgi:hypothetical protein
MAVHLSVLLDDFYYSIDIFQQSDVEKEAPRPLPVAVIGNRLQACVEDVKERRQKGEQPVAVGVLTGDDRDTWTKVISFFIRHHDLPLIRTEP